MDKFEWANQTVLHPLGLVAVVVLGVVTLMLPRRYAVIPFLLMACFISARQRLVVFTLDFSLLRIMVIFGWVRFFMRGEYKGFSWHPLDYVLIAWVAAGMFAATIRVGTSTMLVNQLGGAFDAVGMYFLFRTLVNGFRDVRTIALAFAIISVPVAAAFLVENATGHNMFSVFGGVPENTLIREGKLRCQGAFAHPIMAGCFWASVIPIMAARWWCSGKATAVLGVSMASLVVLLTASSTPVAGVLVVLVGAAVFPFRRWMRLIRWGLALVLLGLHLVMKAPVWHLIARIDLVGGSTGWHRYQLIDRSIKRFGEWWLLGTDSTAHWGHITTDITNQYVLEGVSGGIVTLVLFVAMIVFAYKGVGTLCRIYRRSHPRLILSWAFGVSLLAHTMMFMAVSYFGQIIVVWYLLLAMIASTASLPEPPDRCRNLFLGCAIEQGPLRERKPSRHLVPDLEHHTGSPQERADTLQSAPRIRAHPVVVHDERPLFAEPGGVVLDVVMDVVDLSAGLGDEVCVFEA
jgi:hypothetical protein